MEKEKVKQCPFCGKTPKIAEYAPFVFAVECECGATQTVSISEKDAVEKWNKRKEIDIEGLARFMNTISQNDTHFDICSKKIQQAYKDKAKWIIEYLTDSQ